MTPHHSQSRYLDTFRRREIATLAGWIAAGDSGAVVGGGGAGKSNLFAFLTRRPEALQTHLPAGAPPVVLLPVDLNNLPADDVATFYRAILRAFYESRARFAPELGQTIADLYLENRDKTDPFLPQSALRDLMFQFQTAGVRVVFLIDRFDHFVEIATPAMFNSLRGLRDSFKATLGYIVGMRQEVSYLPEPERLGELYELFDSRVCWVGPMADSDTRQAIASLTAAAPTAPGATEVETMLALTGGYPALVRTVCHWWLATGCELPPESWPQPLLAESSLRFRLAEIWEGLTQEEQQTLVELQKWHDAFSSPKKSRKEIEQAMRALGQRYDYPLRRLVAKGLCRQTETGWRLAGDLLAGYLDLTKPQTRGRITWREETKEFYQGHAVLSDLTPLQQKLLTFLYNHPGPQSKDEIAQNCWGVGEGVTDEAIYQIISSLRAKIEPNPANPRYLKTVRSGGYRLYPEGAPSGKGA